MGYMVSSEVHHNDGDGVRVPVEGDVEFVVRHLPDGPIGQPLVGPEGVNDRRQEFGCDIYAASPDFPSCLRDVMRRNTATSRRRDDARPSP